MFASKKEKKKKKNASDVPGAGMHWKSRDRHGKEDGAIPAEEALAGRRGRGTARTHTDAPQGALRCAVRDHERERCGILELFKGMSSSQGRDAQSSLGSSAA
jgi:hypothetical protein